MKLRLKCTDCNEVSEIEIDKIILSEDVSGQENKRSFKGECTFNPLDCKCDMDKKE